MPPPLRPAEDYVLTFAARTGSETNIHTVDTLRLERCFRDYAAMREAQVRIPQFIRIINPI